MTPRESADQCCDSCRRLPGNGPWCGRCGAERPGVPVEPEGRFTDDWCDTCEDDEAQRADREEVWL
jgi:hypothetical protein